MSIFAWLALSSRVPLTFDESWNWSYVASLGMRHSYLTYAAPNNHILFSMLQSLLPSNMVKANPPTLRAINLLAGCALALVLFLEFGNGWIACAALLASPLFTMYLLVSRGYLLGALFVLAGSMLMWRRRPRAAAVCLAAAACVVPTFILIVPGLALFCLFANRDRLGALIFAGVACLLTGVFYMPTFKFVAQAAHEFNTTVTPEWLLTIHARTIGNPYWMASYLVPALLIGFLFARPGVFRSAALCLLSGCVSYFLCVFAISLGGGANPPYPRNGMFVPLFVWLALAFLAYSCVRPVKIALISLLTVNAIYGLWLMASCFVMPGANPLNYPGFAGLSPVPGRQIVSVPITRITAAWKAAPAGLLYAKKLNVPLDESKSLGGQCLLGTYAPPKDSRISVDLVDGRTGTVCF